MANNIAVTEGSGKTVATEDIGSAQYQKIKIFDGNASGTTGMDVNADGSINASVYGQVNIGSVVGAHALYAQPDSFVFGVTSIVTLTTASSVISAPGASLRNYITQVTVTNAATVGTFVDIKDSGANILYSGYAAASGGGFAASFLVPLRQPTTNASIDVVARTQASVMAAASGYKAA